MRFTKKEQADKDEIILAAIIAASETIGRKVRPHFTRDHVEGSGEGYICVEPSGPCCAVGAGVLYDGLPPAQLSGHGLNNAAVNLFARRYGVSVEYAAGVSYGFEGFNPRYDAGTDERRGYAVGAAAFDALFGAAE